MIGRLEGEEVFTLTCERRLGSTAGMGWSNRQETQSGWDEVDF